MDFLLAVRVRGIEPPTTAWKAVVLPLNYTRSISSDATTASPAKWLDVGCNGAKMSKSVHFCTVATYYSEAGSRCHIVRHKGESFAYNRLQLRSPSFT